MNAAKQLIESDFGVPRAEPAKRTPKRLTARMGKCACKSCATLELGLMRGSIPWLLYQAPYNAHAERYKRDPDGKLRRVAR